MVTANPPSDPRRDLRVLHPRPARPRILVADDTASNVELLRLLLGEGHDLLCASDGRQALDLARAERPDLVLLDAVMPELDGFEVCARLKADPRTAGIPVIFITALEAEADEARALQLGAADFVSKPIRAAAVQARVRNCLELKRQRDLLDRLSFTDGLTGIANRRRFDEALEQEWRRGARGRRRMALLLLDVDHFKGFNDACGHVAGDACLRRIAEAVAEAARRPCDLVARYGGEEFAAVLPETDAPGAIAVGERIQRAAASIPHPSSPTAPVVTLSIGVAVTLPSERLGPQALVDAADRALYAAKAQGRNRIVVAPGHEPRAAL